MSPGSLHDSTISRLIDAVSLGNEQDTRGSISALIGQFESTVDQNDFTSSRDHTPCHHSSLRPITPKALQDLRSPLKTKTASLNKNPLTSPQMLSQKPKKVNHEMLSPCKIPQAGPLAPALLSSPETAELEEVYTILDEEMLLPVSVYNLKKQTVRVEADTVESTPSNSLASSPSKVVQGTVNGHNVGWDAMYRHGDRGQITEETEESVYEEVYDPLPPIPEQQRGSSQRYMGSSVNSSCFQYVPDSAGSGLGEIEINVDEDPLEMTSPRHGNAFEELTSPTKRHAIYQNNESTPKYSQQKHLYRVSQQQFPLHVSGVPFSPCPSPLNHPSYKLSSPHQHQPNPQPSPFHRPVDSQPSNPSPQRQNSYPVPQSNPIAFNDNFNRPFTQQRSYSSNQILNRSHQDRQEYRQMERCFQNGFSSSDNLPGQSVESTNIHRGRGLCSPSSDCDAVYSHLDYDSIASSSESTAPRNTQPHCQSQTQSYTSRQPSSHKVSLIGTRHQSQPETKVSVHLNVGPLSACPQLSSLDPKATPPCKSKSLGDLTSEDISCNFQSKYHIISRSFITPHMRKQKRMGTRGDATFQSQCCDPLTEQLRKLVSLDGEESERERPQSLQLHQETKSPLPHPQSTSVAQPAPRDIDDSPPPLTRRLSSRSQSRVRHINSRARERQQEALKPRAGVMVSSTSSIGGVVLRNKPASENPPVSRHSTGSYIAGYLGQLEDRGLPEGACTSLRYGNGDRHGDRYYTDDSLPAADPSQFVSEPEVYFLLRL